MIAAISAAGVTSKAGLRAGKRLVSSAGSRSSIGMPGPRSEEHTSELQSQSNLVCRLLLEKKKKKIRKDGPEQWTALLKSEKAHPAQSLSTRPAHQAIMTSACELVPQAEQCASVDCRRQRC